MLVFRLGLTAARCCPLIFFTLKNPHLFIDIFDFNPYQDGWGYVSPPHLCTGIPLINLRNIILETA